MWNPSWSKNIYILTMLILLEQKSLFIAPLLLETFKIWGRDSTLRAIFHWLSETKWVENAFLTHRRGPGYRSYDRKAGSSFIASAITDFPTQPT